MKSLSKIMIKILPDAEKFSLFFSVSPAKISSVNAGFDNKKQLVFELSLVVNSKDYTEK